MLPPPRGANAPCAAGIDGLGLMLPGLMLEYPRSVWSLAAPPSSMPPNALRLRFAAFGGISRLPILSIGPRTGAAGRAAKEPGAGARGLKFSRTPARKWSFNVRVGYGTP